MEASKDTHGGEVVDLLDKIFEKGIILDADVVIKLGGVPLVGINLTGAIGGMTSMLKWGIMETWDEDIRKWYAEKAKEKREVPLQEKEELYLETFGSQWYKSTVYTTWRQGRFYLTDRRLFLFQKDPAPEMLFEVELKDIEGIEVKKLDGPGKTEKGLCVEHGDGKRAALHTRDLDNFKGKIEKAIGGRRRGREVKETALAPDGLKSGSELALGSSEELVLETPGVYFDEKQNGDLYQAWKPVHIFVTGERILLTERSSDSIIFEVPFSDIEQFENETVNVKGNTEKGLRIESGMRNSIWIRPSDASSGLSLSDLEESIAEQTAVVPAA